LHETASGCIDGGRGIRGGKRRREGASPSALVREGWSSKTLKPGDELKMTIDPLRSGAPGGSWSEKKTSFSSGQPIVTH